MGQLTTRITAFLEAPVVFDVAIGSLERVNISSGDPMAGLEIRPSDLIRPAKAMLAPIARSPDSTGDR